MKQLSSRTTRTSSDSFVATCDGSLRQDRIAHRFKRCVSSARLVLITTNEKN